MSNTITGLSAHTPLQILGYKSTRQSRHIIHDLANSTTPSVTLRAATKRTGTLRAVCVDSTDGLSLESDLAGARSLTAAFTDISGFNMTFVVDGNLSIELDPETRLRWIVEFDFREI